MGFLARALDALDRFVTWTAHKCLPPPSSIGVRILSYDVTRLDLAIIIIAAGMAAILVVWTGNWLWIPAVAISMLFAWMLDRWFF